MEKVKKGKHYHTPYTPLGYTHEEIKSASESFYSFMDQRRTVRDISNQSVDRSVIENIIKTASSAPSGAHKQPWTFCAISNSEIKKQIRAAAEKEEYESYNGRMSERWLKDLEPIGTDHNKPFLEEAPWLIVVFKRVYEQDEGQK
ncbi:MAG: nitroreductase family protein, partial [Cyclobacteriaceae bacterium]